MDGNFTSLRLALETGDEADLRPLDWSGLCARLAAERDLRRELARGATAFESGSFASRAAAAVFGPLHDARSVNLEALANRKPHGGIGDAADENQAAAHFGARGPQ